MDPTRKSHVILELVIPTILFTSAGLFSWAIRGQSGFGASTGCMFAGTLWGALWFLLSREPTSLRTRRFSSGWSFVMILLGTMLAGMRGWMQWPSWYDGWFIIDADQGIYYSISPVYGWVWMLLTGISWGGLGSIFLAWTGSKTTLSRVQWILRFFFVGGGIAIGYALFTLFPEIFLPLYNEIPYNDTTACPTCIRAINDNRLALVFLCAYLGGLLYEIIRKDKMNVKLILIVGSISGFGWMLAHFLSNHWIPSLFPTINFNWWRLWETTGGGVIGLAYGIAYYVCNRKLSPDHPDALIQPYSNHPNAEKIWGVHFGLCFGLGYSMIAGIKGNLNIYNGIDETLVAWSAPIGLLFIGLWVMSILHTRRSPAEINDGKDYLTYYPSLFLILYIVHRELGLGVTGPLSNSSELIYFVYYLVLSVIDFLVLFVWVRIRKVQSLNPLSK